MEEYVEVAFDLGLGDELASDTPMVPLFDLGEGEGGPTTSGAAPSKLIQEVEIEVKFSVGDNVGALDLGAIGPLGHPVTSELNALYFDTPDLELESAGIALRRRSGGSDAGWHLKTEVSSSGHRIEKRLPISGARPPRFLRSVLPPELQFRPLIPVARLETHRTETPVLSSRRSILANVCEDHVRVDAGPLGGGRKGSQQSAWREVEVELAAGDTRALSHISRLLLNAGLTPATYGSKIARALEGWPRTSVSDLGGHPVQAAVRRYIENQVGVIQSLEEGVAEGEGEAVHQSRVAARRLRSTLDTFSTLFTPTVADHLIGELRWFGRELSALRDLQVLRARLVDGTAAALPSDPQVLAWLLSGVDAAADAAASQVRTDVLGPRYEMLQDGLAELVDPRLQTANLGGSRADLEDILRASPAKPLGKTMKRLQAAEVLARALPKRQTLDEKLQQAHLWHETRKAAKTVRYAYEALAPVLGEEGSTKVLRWQEATSALGELQDTTFELDAIGELERGGAISSPQLSPEGVSRLKQVAEKNMGEQMRLGRRSLLAALRA
ncbi:CYTH and CHAD domain-containing protein [Actinomyces minihominis]|uniref:CYTH and CHAD domain-containing protein n=1 Tax=Actinomyces minihominis TaxID=2002838 RepID=UPI00101AE479|nr:CYTH and CHAD domain-containing protein [Actinomyces minihominis]